jgi:hypothetical protein
MVMDKPTGSNIDLRMCVFMRASSGRMLGVNVRSRIYNPRRRSSECGLSGSEGCIARIRAYVYTCIHVHTDIDHPHV